jgi:flagellar biosynthesis protein
MSDDSNKRQPSQEVVTLKYDGDSAPRVTAKGRGLVAQQILALAEEHNIPLHEDPDLVTLLSQLELGEEIPRNLYIAVAEVIAFAYKLSGKTPPTANASDQ